MPDQRSTTDQLTALYALANRNGLYDAADVVRGWLDDRARFRAERSGLPAPKPTQVFDPAKVRELLVIVEATLYHHVPLEGDDNPPGRVLRDLRRAAQALRDGEGE